MERLTFNGNFRQGVIFTDQLSLAVTQDRYITLSITDPATWRLHVFEIPGLALTLALRRLLKQRKNPAAESYQICTNALQFLKWIHASMKQLEIIRTNTPSYLSTATYGDFTSSISFTAQDRIWLLTHFATSVLETTVRIATPLRDREQTMRIVMRTSDIKLKYLFYLRQQQKTFFFFHALFYFADSEEINRMGQHTPLSLSSQGIKVALRLSNAVSSNEIAVRLQRKIIEHLFACSCQKDGPGYFNADEKQPIYILTLGIPPFESTEPNHFSMTGIIGIRDSTDLSNIHQYRTPEYSDPIQPNGKTSIVKNCVGYFLYANHLQESVTREKITSGYCTSQDNSSFMREHVVRPWQNARRHNIPTQCQHGDKEQSSAVDIPTRRKTIAVSVPPILGPRAPHRDYFHHITESNPSDSSPTFEYPNASRWQLRHTAPIDEGQEDDAW
jgi:hypothetical protein